MADILMEKNLRLLSHVDRMDNNRPLKPAVILSTLFGNA